MPQPAPGVVQPPKQLKGFAHLEIGPGETVRATFELDARALSYWDIHTASWRVAPGCYSIMVGTSSRDVPLSAIISQAGASCS
jgi:beta-glucosidase